MDASRTPTSFDDLLEHADWVRGLAYRLVNDAARADDLVQQAWLRALESPPRHSTNLRAWLGSVVTRLAQSEWRSDRSRSVREERGAREEALPPTDQLVHEAQLSSQLVEAVVAMDEPFKTVLLLRYFRDQKPTQIARELQRPVATVKTQLQRGLEQLRKQLDGTHGDRRSWCLALLPLARGGAPSAGLVSLGTATWVAAAGIAAIATWGATNMWPGGLERAEVPHQERLALAPSSPETGAPLGGELASVPNTDSRDSASAATVEPVRPAASVAEAPKSPELYTLTGRVLGMDLEPRAGRKLRWTDTGKLSWLNDEQRIITGKNTWVPISSKQREAFAADDAALKAFAEEKFGRPQIAMALLRGESPPSFTTVTDADGWFSLETPERAFDLELVDGQEDIVGRSKMTGADGTEIATWFAEPRRTFRGRCVDPNGAEVGGVRVSVSGEFPQELSGKLAMGSGFSSQQRTVTTDAQGRFAFEGLGLGRRLWVSAEEGEFEGPAVFVELPLEVSEEPAEVVVALWPRDVSAAALVLRGRVLLDDGTPAPRATVVLGVLSTTTDKNGEYVLPLSPSAGLLYAGRSGSGIAIGTEDLGDLAGITGEIRARDLVLPRGSLAIEGHVLDEAGKPVAAAEIALRNATRLPDGPRTLEQLVVGRQLKTVETDEHGRFRLEGLADRDYVLRVRSGDRFTLSPPIRAGHVGAVIRLP